MPLFLDGIDTIALIIEVLGVAIIVGGFAITSWRFLHHRMFHEQRAFMHYRHGIARSLILGLDFLIAGDIIKTVIIVNTGQQVATLGVIVLIRAFLAFTLHVEVEGHWPWQDSRYKNASSNGRRDTND
ncbi:MAG: DUF1622 domain-containing protein [Halomonas sp.]|jgi:uncharacterized membrane protein|uniref:DUF1622 domain-containing protein n=1 Tax=Billgrantia tianxiuensis TaxID=2497861 RepID=A0A6I6SP92_9GAMM|nr:MULTISPECIES: DUF1622 domain-containing protein [Halomonas]MCE8035564.1 DUF1622 domain-containing protein [Halomonas sp. MCCC 1A11057]MDX5434370.1 DUF1622 domain-containing protein [Halomonas sp.]QHC51682.1 DUF1622 domain-containing protein [Halomonas tianxiuensis]